MKHIPTTHLCTGNLISLPAETSNTCVPPCPPVAVVDGEPDTTWKSDPGGKVVAHLGNPKPHRSVDIHWIDDFPQEYIIEDSSDRKTWKPLVHRSRFKHSPFQKKKVLFMQEYASDKVEPSETLPNFRIRPVAARKKLEIRDILINGHYAFSYETAPKETVCLAAQAPDRSQKNRSSGSGCRRSC